MVTHSSIPAWKIPLTKKSGGLQFIGSQRVRHHWSDFSSVQSLSRIQLFVTPWITACQASLSITISRNSFRLMSIESMMPSSYLIFCRPLLLLPPIPPSIRVFSNESTLRMSGQSTGVSALASFLPKKSQDWSPSEWTGWISLQSKGLSRVFSNTTVQKHQFLKWLSTYLIKQFIILISIFVPLA